MSDTVQKGQIVKRTKRVEFSGDYEGFEAVVWVNPPMKVLDQMQSGISKEIYDGICSLVILWNFRDEQGNPIEISPAGVRDSVPVDLVIKIVEIVSSEITSPKATKPPR